MNTILDKVLKAIQSRPAIRRLVISYFLIFSTPLLSIFVFLGTYGLANLKQNYLVPIMVHTAINTGVITVLIIGMTLYFLEYKRSLARNSISGIAFVFSPLLVLWGIVETYVAVGFYQELVQWSRMPEVRALTVWDYLEYGSWILKGILWMISGVFLTITYIMMKARETHPR